ncbi:FGGY family carbohydrate kinase [Nakamurella leprariae]|uniref:Glycerol kinase n=1 Tax=Nakamurella leprariae TaxID=2803911 RepID=A0A939C149_9ACTN|nr:FGGY family carbohydrate kinase [Nakamurella leprariae]MBM9466812.1 hypothetical protein [Nakamurella leprariae]
MTRVVLALDCGTHAVRSIVFDADTGRSTICASEDIPLHFPRAGWVEVDPEVVAASAIRVLRSALAWAANSGHRVIGLGIADMRETAFAWSRSGQQPLYPGVMWMSQQSEPVVRRWRDQGLEPLIRQRTGLSNDTFFFGSKVAWMLEHVPIVRAAAEAGDLAVGTVDAWLVNRLTGGQVHRTDVSNASRTQLLDLRTGRWDPELGIALGIPLDCLPEVMPSMAPYGVTHPAVCGQEVPITGVLADQQASLLGHGCETRGTAKATFGTSGVVSLNTGPEILLQDGLVTSIGWGDGRSPLVYEIEGSAFHSGYTMSWMSEHTGHPVRFDLADDPPEKAAGDRVYVLPSFTVMGAPRWPKGRGAAITGLAMDTTTTEIMRAGVEAMAFQAYDLFAAIGHATDDTTELNVDGGGAGNDFLCGMLADLLGREVVRPDGGELTSVGVAKAVLRGLGEQTEPYWGQDRAAARRFRPRANRYAREGYERWVELIGAILGESAAAPALQS